MDDELDMTCSCDPGCGRPQEAMPDFSDERVAALFKAMAHPARVRILRRLCRCEGCVCGTLVDELPLAQSTVSEHLRVLKAAGLVIGTVDGPRRCYCVDAAALASFKRLVAAL